MTIQDAIESGKPFKRPIHVGWMWRDGDGIHFDGDGLSGGYRLSMDDILATDWETK